MEGLSLSERMVSALNALLLVSIMPLGYFLADKLLKKDFRERIIVLSGNISAEYRKKQIVSKVLRRERIKKKTCKSIFYKLEMLIEKSGIQEYIFFIDFKFLIAVCAVSAGAFFAIFKSFFGVLSVAAITSLPGFFMPIFLLEIMIQQREKEIEKILGDYLLQLKNSTRIHNDIIEAFRNVQDKCMEPLKTFTIQFVAEISSGISVEEALANFRDKIDMKKFKLFLTNVQYCYIYGGDFTELLDKTQRLIADIQKEKRIRIRETRSARMVIFLLILIDIYLYFNFIVTQPDYLSIMKNTFYGQLILNANFLSVWILLWLSHSVKKLDY